MIPSARDWLCAVAVGACAAAGYVLLQGDLTHEFDLYWMLPMLRDDNLVYPRHPLAFPLMWCWLEVLQGFGDLHERLRLANGLSTGIAVGALLLVARIAGAPLRRALAACLLFAALPVTVRFATVAELHGLFLPFAVVSLVLPIVLLRRREPRPASAALLGTAGGVVTGLTTGVHATGHLLVCAIVTWLALARWRRGERRALLAALLGIVLAHATVTWSLQFAIDSDEPRSIATQQLQWFNSLPWTLDGLGSVVVGEYLWPLLPISLLWPIAAWRLGGRPALAAAVTLLGSFAAYLACCLKLLAWPRHGQLLFENGAYLLPLALLVALVAARTLRARHLLLAACVAAAASTYDAFRHAPPPGDPEFGAAAQRYLETHDVRLMTGDAQEYEAVFYRLYEDASKDPVRKRVARVWQLAFESRRGDRDPQGDQLALWFHPSLAGRPTLLTDSALAQMRALGGAFAECADTWLPLVYTLERVDDGGLHGVLLRPR